MPLKKQVVNTLISAFILIFQNGLIYAQGEEAFDSLEIGWQYVMNINRNRFHDFYQPVKGFEGFAEMPFYYGDIQIAIQALSYSAVNRDRTQDFEGIFTQLKWGKKYRLLYGVRWFTGIGVGFNAFLPRQRALPELAHFTETELSVGLNTHFSYPIHKNWTVRISGDYNYIFTYKPIQLAYFSTGIGYSFDTPKWLKGFLE
ncbi:hypothetical protein IH992_27360 [Candidatus Poribacteria bacterium]|nr:hypothetical protein [Candidatus Poribacteria bacterium]